MSGARLSWSSKLAYGLGKCPDVIKLRSFDLFALFFYSQVLGLPGSLAGLAIFLIICVDAIWDPIAGTISDGLKNAPLGRRLTPMACAAIPAAIAFYLLFSPPPGLSHGALFVWMLASAIGLRCSMTFYQIPYVALQAELSDERPERASLLTISSVFRMAAEFSLLWVAFHVFFGASPGFANGQQNPAAYPRYGMAVGVVMGAAMLVCTALLLPGVRRMRNFKASSPSRVAGLLRPSLWRAVLTGNPDYRALITAVLIFAVATGINSALNLYLGTYLFRLKPAEMAQWGQALLLGSFVALIFLVKWVVKRFEIKQTFVIAMVTCAGIQAAMTVVFLLGLWPASWPVIWLLVAGNFLAGAVNASNMVAPPLMCSIAVDDYEYRTGQPQQGLMFGILHFSQKAGTAFGSLFAGIFIDLVHFPKGAAVSAIGPGQIGPIAWFYVGGLFLANLLAWLALRSYRLRNADHDVMVRQLEERRAATPELNDDVPVSIAPANA
jgi:GPH family glycoside/pentoside/hexuronide:cation symporter